MGGGKFNNSGSFQKSWPMLIHLLVDERLANQASWRYSTAEEDNVNGYIVQLYIRPDMELVKASVCGLSPVNAFECILALWAPRADLVLFDSRGRHLQNVATYIKTMWMYE